MNFYRSYADQPKLMRYQNLHDKTPILDIVSNYCKMEYTFAEKPAVSEAKIPEDLISLSDDDPLLYYLSISG